MMALAALASACSVVVPAHASESTYLFDKGHTQIRYCWSHFGLSRQCATITDFDGQLVYDDADPTKSKLNVTFKAASIETLNPVFNDHLKGERFFEVNKYPTITFVSTKIEKTGDKTGKVTGDLTIKGITKPVTLDTTLNFAGMHPLPKNGPSLGFGAQATLKRSDFGVGALAPAVSDEVSLEIQTEMNLKK
jgi:polyisoprenoid-binding protein YceI